MGALVLWIFCAYHNVIATYDHKWERIACVCIDDNQVELGIAICWALLNLRDKQR